ncbi:MAG: archease [Staphylothermus sp.]|nr:archease [Staphylothermus sp.]
MNNDSSEKIVERGIPGKFDYLEHTADIYIVAYGSDLLTLYENAGLALFESMTDTASLERKIKKEVTSEGFDLESLLYRWLEDLLTLYYSENIMCGEIKVHELNIERTDENELSYTVEGECIGDKFDPSKYEPKVEVKAVTYHMMRIIKNEEGWKAYFVLDI